jgi:drug/metabolite transporter (DMT)-like permease
VKEFPRPGLRAIHLVLLAVMNCLWAATYSTFKVLPPSLTAGDIATLRFGISGALLILCWPWLPGSAPRGRDLVRTAAMGIIVFAIGPRLQVAGVLMGRAADASLLVAVDPLITSLAAAIFLREHIGPRRWIGFVLGLAGTVLLAEAWRPGFQLRDLTASALILLSFVGDAAYSVMGKPLLQRAGLLKVIAVALLAGSVINILLDGASAVRAAVGLPFPAWMILGYLSLICTVAGFALWYVVIQNVPVNVAALTVFIQPVVGVVVAVMWLGESFHWGQIWGSLVIVAGLLVGLSRQIRQPSAP